MKTILFLSINLLLLLLSMHEKITAQSQTSKNNNGTPLDILAIGSVYQGGIIAYLLHPGDPGYDGRIAHGLIAAPTDQSKSAQWGCYTSVKTGAYGTLLGTGNQNTIEIMAGCSEAGIAARVCFDLVLNGYSDWYLPGKDELNKLYLNRISLGNFSATYYWSSSARDGYNAWNQNFKDGKQYCNDEINAYCVRAVRNF